MEGRKLRRNSANVEEKKEMKPVKKIDSLGALSKILMVVFTILAVAVFGIVIYLKVLPNKYLIPMCVSGVLGCVFGIFLVFRKKTKNIIKGIISCLAVLGIGILIFVGLKLAKTISFLGTMTTTTVNAKTYSVVVLKDSKYEKIEDIQYKILLYYDTELNKNKEAIDKLDEAITLVIEKTDDVHELAQKLLDSKVDAILIEDSYYAMIEEEIADFKSKIKVIYTFTLEDTLETIAKNVSVTKEPFVIYVSGIDSYGTISSVARSDVNMLIVVNPQTKQILLVNTPRDYYVQLNGTYGYRDKLTHAGIYGIDMSVKTMEDLYSVDVNYYVRVNFTSLIDIIDAIGGIEVYSEYDFTSRIGGYHFKKGMNKMNGKKALGFARERYSFADGDRMRGQNQQAVINAMIEKVCSSSTILTKFDALLDSLKGSFQTNMGYEKMIEIVRMQITDGAEWNISSISVDGSGSLERTYSMGKTRLSVLIPYAGSINKAESMIKSVLNGEMLEAGSIDISSYNDYLVVPRGVYEEEKKEEEDKEEVPEGEEIPGDGENVEGEQPEAGDGTEVPEENPENGGTTGNEPENPGDSGNEGDSTQGGTENEGGSSQEPNEGENNGGNAPEDNVPTEPEQSVTPPDETTEGGEGTGVQESEPQTGSEE